MEIKVYHPEDYALWNNFNENSKNGLFLFDRNYMDYHSYLFCDNSLMFYKNDKLIALLPAHREGGQLTSHSGLSFGGMITSKRMQTTLMLDIFRNLKQYLKEEGFKTLFYKAIPHLYHLIPAQEDLYALFRNQARLVRRDVSSAIKMDERISFNRNRRRNLKKSQDNGLEVSRSDRFSEFIEMENINLQNKYNTVATHTPQEMELLSSRFPDNIKLFVVEEEEEIISGVVVYESTQVAHAQYQTSNPEGIKSRAIDLIFSFLINDFYTDKKYFSFGISTRKQGNYLNQGLIKFKESFGARAVIHDFYRMDI
ncbi:hypothetical protein JCM15415_00120 [Methanobacterium movens]